MRYDIEDVIEQTLSVIDTEIDIDGQNVLVYGLRQKTVLKDCETYWFDIENISDSKEDIAELMDMLKDELLSSDSLSYIVEDFVTEKCML